MVKIKWYQKPIFALLTLGLVLSLSLVMAVPAQANAATLYEYYSAGDIGSVTASSTWWEAQTFTAESDHTVTSVKLKLHRAESEFPGIVIVSIRATDENGHPKGVDLTWGTTDGDTLTTANAGEWREVALNLPYFLTSGTKYAIVLMAPSAPSGVYVRWRLDTSGEYAFGNRERSTDGGVSWDDYEEADLMFEVYGFELMTVNYGDLTLDEPLEKTHWDDVWDLTQCGLMLSYTIDMSGITQPHGLPGNPTEWEAYVGPTAKDPANYPDSYTPWVEVGLRGEGASDFNPGPFYTYQGKCGGWLVSESDDWVGYWDGDTFRHDGTEIQDLDDKHSLQASGGRAEWDYDVLLSDPYTVLTDYDDPAWLTGPSGFGNHDSHGLWFDRDGLDPWQPNNWGNKGPGGVGSGDGLRYNTEGIYDIVITYHAIDDGMGVMFATVNGYPQGFYTTWVNGPPQLYPAGLSFKGDMAHMQVFAGWLAYDPAGWDYGSVQLSNITIAGCLGVSDPLVPDFTFSPPNVGQGEPVQFTDATHGGMPPYSYSWDFDGDHTEDSTDQNPTWTYDTPGPYEVTLTVTPHRCEAKAITKYLSVRIVGGEVYPINKVGIMAPWIALAVVIAAGGAYLFRLRVRI